MMLFLRALTFNILFFLWTIFCSILAVPGLVLGRKYVHKRALLWSRGVLRFLRVVGITVEVRGREHLTKGPVIIACKHQSAWETAMTEYLAPECVVILKRELTWIPIFGQLLLKAGMISIDRSKRKRVVPQIIAGAKRAFAEGRSLLIFPEGSRTRAGERGSYKRGVFSIYEGTNVPVVPAAHNAGYFWGRRQFLKRPGKIIFEFLPPIYPGLHEQEFMTRLSDDIEVACERLAPPPQIKEKKPFSLRKFLVIAASFVVLTTAGYVALWMKAAEHLSEEINRFVERANTKETELAFQGMKVTGFPFKLEANIKDPQFTHQMGLVKIEGILKLKTTLWDFGTINFSTQGKTEILSKVIPSRTLANPIDVSVSKIEGIFNLDDDSLDASFTNATLKTGKTEAFIDAGQINKGSSLSLDIQGIGFGEGQKAPFDRKVDHLELTAKVEGLFGPEFSKQMLQTWYDEGGVIEVENLLLAWGDLALKGDGTLALDKELQPIAAFSVEIKGLDETIDYLSKYKVLKKKAASIAKMVLTFFKDQDSAHKVSISVQGGELSVGSVSLMQFPKIVWPGV